MTQKKIHILKGESYQKIAEEIIKTPFKVILLEGGLGAGKTSFTRDFVRVLNDQSTVKEDFESLGVMSPTFSLINEYRLRDCSVMHADFYRLEEGSFDVEEILETIGQNDFSFIEWAEKIPHLKETLESFVLVKIKRCDDESREVSLKFKKSV